MLLLRCLFLAIALADTGIGGLLARSLESPNFVIYVENADLSLFSLPEREHYTLLVLSSTDERHGCDSCKTLENAVHRLGSAWAQDYATTNYLYIAYVDIVDRSNIALFEKAQIGLIPQVWLIPPSHIADAIRNKSFEPGSDSILFEPRADFELPDASFDEQVFQLVDWVARTTQKRIVIPQENPVSKFALTFAATFAAILFFKKMSPQAVQSNFKRVYIYQALLFAVFLGILGGYLFTAIEGVPFIARNDQGSIIYVSGGTSYQFGVEIVLVAGHYFLLAANFVLLTYLGRYKVTESSAIASEGQKFATNIAAALSLYVIYSSYTSMYLRKDNEYPYLFTQLF